MTEHHNGLLPSKAPSGTPPRRLETGGRSPDTQGLPLGALLSDPTVTLPSSKQVTHRVEPAHDYTPCSARRVADPRSEPCRKARRTVERGRTRAYAKKGAARNRTAPRETSLPDCRRLGNHLRFLHLFHEPIREAREHRPQDAHDHERHDEGERCADLHPEIVLVHAMLAARMALMTCVAGKNGLTAWKKLGSSCKGKLPPPPVT